MFSRDDYGRGRRFPLLWVLGPLVLGAILITAIAIGLRAMLGFPNIELGEEVRQAAATGDPLLAEITPFAWDEVCVFPDRVTPDQVDARLGFAWGRTGGYPTGTDLLLVFVRDGEVETHIFVRRGVVAAPPDDGDCRAPEDESTRL